MAMCRPSWLLRPYEVQLGMLQPPFIRRSTLKYLFNVTPSGELRGAVVSGSRGISRRPDAGLQPLGMGGVNLGLDVRAEVADGLEVSQGIVRNVDVELLFTGDHDLEKVEAVGRQIRIDTSVFGERAFIDAELEDKDVSELCANVATVWLLFFPSEERLQSVAH